jgi:hypothetical protein
MKSPADWGNSATFFLHFPNEINNLDRHFESHHQPIQRSRSRMRPR